MVRLGELMCVGGGDFQADVETMILEGGLGLIIIKNTVPNVFSPLLPKPKDTTKNAIHTGT